jgi:hypothetical protein
MAFGILLPVLIKDARNAARSHIAPSAWPGKYGCPQRFPRTVSTPKQLSLKPEMGTVASPILSQSKAMAEPQSAATGNGKWVSLSESLPSIGHPRAILPEAPKRTVVFRCFRNWTLMEALDPTARIHLLVCDGFRLKTPVAELQTGNGTVVVGCLVFRLFCLVQPMGRSLSFLAFIDAPSVALDLQQ